MSVGENSTCRSPHQIHNATRLVGFKDFIPVRIWARNGLLAVGYGEAELLLMACGRGGSVGGSRYASTCVGLRKAQVQDQSLR